VSKEIAATGGRRAGVFVRYTLEPTPDAGPGPTTSKLGSAPRRSSTGTGTGGSGVPVRNVGVGLLNNPARPQFDLTRANEQCEKLAARAGMDFAKSNEHAWMDGCPAMNRAPGRYQASIA